jgi:hypothetical protein
VNAQNALLNEVAHGDSKDSSDARAGFRVRKCVPVAVNRLPPRNAENLATIPPEGHGFIPVHLTSSPTNNTKIKVEH